jgi:radical SAM protein with 4Fe4S-binding SPASM domain
MFHRLELETSSWCNRTCVGCVRNSEPDRDLVASWFDKTARLPLEDIGRVFRESKDMGFTGELCVSHFNEPLYDDRLVDILKMARGMGHFKRIFFCSNADYITPELAGEIDGLVDDIGFSFYMDEPVKSQRKTWVRSLFKKTDAQVHGGDHMVTHNSPLGDVVQISKRHRSKPCHLPKRRFIVNHKGQMTLCCDDVFARYNLGTIYDGLTMEELWYSDEHQKYVLALEKPNGRNIHPHCQSCPRP